jgi:BlaI family transcriptional regulator, penicillinase repressor
MKNEKNSLSKTEWSIMKICWQKGKTTAKMIYEESQKEKHRDYSTISTMLERLVHKKYLKKEKFGPVWLYEPAAKKSHVVAQAIESFAETVLDNAIAPLFAYFAKKEDLKPEEIEELKKLIKKGRE